MWQSYSSIPELFNFFDNPTGGYYNIGGYSDNIGVGYSYFDNLEAALKGGDEKEIGSMFIAMITILQVGSHWARNMKAKKSSRADFRLEDGSVIKMRSEVGKSILKVVVKEGVEQQAKVVAMKGLEKAAENPGFLGKFLSGVAVGAARLLGVVSGVLTPNWTRGRNRNERPLPTFSPQPELKTLIQNMNQKINKQLI